MTNLEIIISEAVKQGIFSEEQIEAYLIEGDLPLKTYKSWKEAGFIVRKGQKAKLRTKLWQLKVPDKKKENEEKEITESFILAPAYLFTADQVVPITE